MKSKIDGILKAATDRCDLHNQTDSVRDRIANDSRLTDNERKQVEAALKPTEDFLAKNPNASSSDIQKEKKALADRLAPLYERSDKLRQLSSEADRIRDRLNTDASLAASAPTVTDKERKDIQDAIADANEWVRTKGATATPKEIDAKKKELVDKVTLVLARIDARNGLEEYSRNVQNKLNSNDPIMNLLSSTDKKQINDNAQAALDWLESNPKATKQQVDEYLEQLKNKIKPVLERAEKRAALSDYAGDLRGKLGGALGAGNDVDFGGDFDDLSYEDRKAIDDQTRAIQDWLSTKPNATAKDISDKQSDIKKNLDPIVKKAELRNELKDMANTINDKVNETLTDHISNRDKQALQDLIDDNVDFLNRTKKQPVSRQDLEDRLKQLQSSADAIVKRAQLTKDMQDYISETKKKQDDPEFGKHLTLEEKKKVDAATQDAQDWLKLNKNSPTLTPDQVQEKFDALKETVKPLIEKAEEKRSFLEYANALQKRLAEDKALNANLTTDEKKKLTDKLNEELKWLNSTPGASVDEIREHRKKLESVCGPIIDRVDAKIALGEYIKETKDQLNDKDLASHLTADEKRTIETTIKDAETWIANNPKATKRDYDQKRKEIQNKINPLLDRAKEKRNLINYATNIRDRIKNDAQLASILTKDEKKLIDDTASEVIEWVKKHGDKATLAELKKKKDHLEKTINSILESKDERNNLLEYARKVLDILNNNEEVRKGMTKDELRDVDDYAQAVLDWLAEHPNATAHEIRMMKKQLEDNLAKVKNFKFVVPYKQFVGFRFNEQTRWGISENRSKEFMYGSYLQQQERREREAALRRGDKPKEEVKPQPTGEKKFKVAGKSKYSQLGLSKQDEEDLKLFTTLRGSKGGLIQATLNSLQDTTGRVKAEFGSVVAESGASEQATYPYAQLKNGNKTFPQGVDPNKREQYLSETEFQQVFKMSKAEFNRLANFKQQTLKKNAELFKFAYEQ